MSGPTPGLKVRSSRLLRAELRGSARERGRAHGELFGAQARESGILDFYRGFCAKEAFSALPKPAAWALDKLHPLFASRLSACASELVAGFCEGSGLEERRVREGLAMPDVLNFLVGLTGRVLAAPTLGCTSAAAWGDYTEDGRFLYARNLDFPGTGTWDRFPLLLRHRPASGIPYVSIGSAGSIADGITGLNEEGLSVALHQHYTTEVGPWPSGRPILDIALEVLGCCRDIEQAIEVCARAPAISGWSVVLTHWKERQACVVQKTARRTAASWSKDGLFVHTNTFPDAALRSTELNRPVFFESSRLRKRRALEILETEKGKVSAATMAGLLNDRLDCERGLLRAFGQAIHQPYTVTSVVFDPERGLAWMSEGRAPVCEGPYRAMSLWDDSPSDQELRPADPLPEERRRAYGRYLDAYHAWQDRRDAGAAFAALGEAVAQDPGEPIYRHMRGLTALKLGELEEARASFEAGAALPDISHRRLAQKFWQARALDLLGRRGQAQALYGAVAAEKPVGALAAAAEKGAHAACRSVKVLPDFIYGDAYVY
jgi:tetratricopeptide (TPR) repeat protein